MVLVPVTPADKVYEYVQFGHQTDPNTPVAATTRIGVRSFDWNIQDNRYRAATKHGDYEPTHRTARGMRRVPVTLTCDLYLDTMPLLLASVMSNAPGSPVTVETTGRRWRHVTSNKLAKWGLTAEHFDGNNAWQVQDLRLTSARVEWTEAGEVTCSFDGDARDVVVFGDGTEAAMTVIADTNPEPIMSWKKHLFLGAAGTALSALTEVDDALLGGNWACANGGSGRNNKNGQRYRGHVRYQSFAPTMQVNALMAYKEFEFAEFNSDTHQVVMVEFRHQLITAAWQGLRLYACGAWNAYDLTDDDGSNAVVLSIDPAEYDPTVGSSAGAEVTNLIASY